MVRAVGPDRQLGRELGGVGVLVEEGLGGAVVGVTSGVVLDLAPELDAEPLRRAGRNALLLFVLGASGVLDMCLGAVYVTSGDGRRRNVVDVARDDLFRAHVSGGGTRSNPHARADLLFAVAVAAFWAAVAWVLDAREIYWTA